MKLYTEEQVRQAFDNGYEYASTLRPASIGEHYKYVENSINALTPIELPSDEEIDEKFDTGSNRSDSQIYESGFRDGAKWVIEQIKSE